MGALPQYFKGELAERSNAAVLKTASPQGLGGSNPTLSANQSNANRLILRAKENKPSFQFSIQNSR